MRRPSPHATIPTCGPTPATIAECESFIVSRQDIANIALYLPSPFGTTISGQAIGIDADMQTTM